MDANIPSSGSTPLATPAATPGTISTPGLLEAAACQTPPPHPRNNPTNLTSVGRPTFTTNDVSSRHAMPERTLRRVALSMTEDTITLTPTDTPIRPSPPPIHRKTTSTPHTETTVSTESSLAVSTHTTASGRSNRSQSSFQDGDLYQHPNNPTRLVQFHGRSKKTWYSVVVGRQTGVFDDWQVLLYIFLYHF
jgi:hypothetical protein